MKSRERVLGPVASFIPLSNNNNGECLAAFVARTSRADFFIPAPSKNRVFSKLQFLHYSEWNR
jgi:hypothetical protein